MGDYVTSEGLCDSIEGIICDIISLAWKNMIHLGEIIDVTLQGPTLEIISWVQVYLPYVTLEGPR